MRYGLLLALNPFKKNSINYARLELVYRAIKDCDKLRVSDIEFGYLDPLIQLIL